MADLSPVETTNLDIYGHDAIPWSRPHDLLAAGMPEANLATTGADGRPHAVYFGALWHDGDIYLVSGPGTRKSRNLAHNPACAVSVRLPGLDLVLEGEAHRVTDRPTLEALAARYRDGGWPAEVEGEAFTAPYSAPSAGPPPWYLYRITFSTAYGITTDEPYGATRWRFDR
jgi:hypothetical protein